VLVLRSARAVVWPTLGSRTAKEQNRTAMVLLLSVKPTRSADAVRLAVPTAKKTQN